MQDEKQMTDIHIKPSLMYREIAQANGKSLIPPGVGDYSCVFLSSNEGWELFARSKLLWEAADTRVKCKNNTGKIILVILTRLRGAMKSTDTDQRPKRDLLR